MWFELILAVVLVILYLAFCAWHSQGGGKLAQAEIDQYVTSIEKLPLPEKAVQAFITRLRSWAEADDGKPVYMFNLIYFFPKLQPFPGTRFQGNTGTGQCVLRKKLDLAVVESRLLPNVHWSSPS